MFLIIASLFINFLLTINGDKFHNCMTKEERESIFRVNHNDVHNVTYEVVPLVTKCLRLNGSNEIECPGLSSGFEKHSIYLETFGEHFELYLEENNNNILFGDQTPVIMPFVGPDGKIKYDIKVYDLIPVLNMSVYHDRKKRTAVTLHEDEHGRINVNGVINDTFIIRSIPERLHEEVLNKNFNLSRPLSGSKIDKAHNHIVIKRAIQSSSDSEVKYHRSGNEGHILEKKPRRSKPCLPKSPDSLPKNREFTVYPKILVVLDHATYLLNNKDVKKCVRHALAYWNVVDLRFREIEKPKIRLNIAGIIVATEPNVTPYMEGRKQSENSRYDEETLEDIQNYFAKENVTGINYDIVVGISPWKMVQGGNWWEPIINLFTTVKLDDSIHGIASFKSICKYPRKAVAFVRDGGDLFGAHVAVHEIGHILGVQHDPEDLSEDDPNYESHWKHGFIMSYARVNKNQLHWSNLSIRQMQRFLQNAKHNHCLLEKPIVGTPYRKLFPGKFVSRDKQCQVLLGNESYSIKRSLIYLSDCMYNYCYSPTDKAIVRMTVPLAEGTLCGPEKICIEGECVKDPTDPIVYRDLALEFRPAD